MNDKRSTQVRLWQILGVLIGFGLLSFAIINLRLYKAWWPEWNLFLALIPLTASTLIRYLAAAPAAVDPDIQTARIGQATQTRQVSQTGAGRQVGQTGSTAQVTHRGLTITLLAIVWFLFLPNAFYYLTDLLYIAPLGRGIAAIHPFKPQNLTATHLWIPILFIATGTFISVLAGVLAVHDIHRLLRERVGLAAWQVGSLLGLLFLLNGLGIYLGRFARLNSWDIVLPWKLVSDTIGSLNRFALEFSLVAAISIAIIYTAFCLLGASHHQSR